MSDKEFRNYHQELKTYANNLIKKHFFSSGLKLDFINVDDLVNEAILNECYDIESAKKPIRNYLFKESRNYKGKKQYDGISSGYEKRCNKCGKIKPASEYTVIFNKESNYTYLAYICKPCNAEAAREYRRKNPLTEDQRLKAKKRYERYKQRQKLLKSQTRK
jgi:MinD superfamily P-loop ATPase